MESGSLYSPSLFFSPFVLWDEMGRCWLLCSAPPPFFVWWIVCRVWTKDPFVPVSPLPFSPAYVPSWWWYTQVLLYTTLFSSFFHFQYYSFFFPLWHRGGDEYTVNLKSKTRASLFLSFIWANSLSRQVFYLPVDFDSSSAHQPFIYALPTIHSFNYSFPSKHFPFPFLYSPLPQYMQCLITKSFHFFLLSFSPLFRMDNLISKMRIVLLKKIRLAVDFPPFFDFVCLDVFE